MPAVSKTKSVGLYGRRPPYRPDPRREIWVYDAALSVLLAQVIRTVEELPPARRPAWWASCEGDLRIQATISDFFFDLHLGLEDDQREEFARLLEDAAACLLKQRAFTADEAAGWRVLDDLTVIFRGTEPEDTGPVAELGQALADLIRGTLPAPPPNMLWFYGAPGGRRAIQMASLGTDGNDEPPVGHATSPPTA
jgi:hypothetical protein